jgi:hypothetical protein
LEESVERQRWNLGNNWKESVFFCFMKLFTRTVWFIFRHVAYICDKNWKLERMRTGGDLDSCDEIYHNQYMYYGLNFHSHQIFFKKNNSLKYGDTCPKKSAQMIKF